MEPIIPMSDPKAAAETETNNKTGFWRSLAQREPASCSEHSSPGHCRCHTHTVLTHTDSGGCSLGIHYGEMAPALHFYVLGTGEKTNSGE